MKTLPAPQGFVLVDHPGVQVLARKEAVPWVRYLVEGGETLYRAAGGDRDAVQLPGRAPVWVIPAKASPGTQPQAGSLPSHWVVRHYARGGRVLPRILGDRFLRAGELRPIREILTSQELRARGVPTPRVMAAAVYEAGFFYRADLVTAFIPDSENLAETLFDIRRKGAGGAAERLEALGAAGALLRAAAGKGLQHGDLNAGNILLQWTGASPSAHLLDLDRAKLLPEGTPARAQPMLRRLVHSLRKWERRTGLSLSAREWETLEAAAVG